MSSSTLPFQDSWTMIRRQLLHLRRYPSLTAFVIGTPVVVQLLFVYVLGSTLSAGLNGIGIGRDRYVEYVTPGILLMALAGAAQGTAISVAMDMTGGIVTRLRTMAISRGAVLTGHVVASLVQAMLAVATVLGVSLLIGFRPAAGPVGWAGAIALLALATLALTWLSVGLGLAAPSVETASNTPMFLMLLPFLGSGFVPTDSMPVALRLFAQYQPFTPIIESVRALLMGTSPGSSLPLAVGWCLAIAAGGYLWSLRLYERVRVSAT